jgi:hypothetical protein
MQPSLHSPDHNNHAVTDKASFNLCRFAEVLGAIRFSSTGETVKFGISADPGDLIKHPLAA